MRRATSGIHHVTAIAGDAQRNLDFYAGTLGLRLVKRTVNFDDPSSYHFYFGDERGTPGSLVTFFPWGADAPRGRAGAGAVASIALAIPTAGVGYWLDRLVRHRVRFEGPTSRGGERVLSLTDPDGLRLELVTDDAVAARPGWGGGGVDDAHAIRGVRGVTLWVARLEPTAAVLGDALGLRGRPGHDGVTRFVAGDAGSETAVDVRAVGGFLAPILGAGAVHHVAFRAADDDHELELRAALVGAGLRPTEQLDRQYFRSVYAREPGGVLLEIATDAPGFAIDEPLEALGRGLMLPPPLEAHRAEVERALPTIHLSPEATPLAAARTEDER